MVSFTGVAFFGVPIFDPQPHEQLFASERQGRSIGWRAVRQPQRNMNNLSPIGPILPQMFHTKTGTFHQRNNDNLGMFPQKTGEDPNWVWGFRHGFAGCDTARPFADGVDTQGLKDSFDEKASELSFCRAKCVCVSE